LTLNDQTKTASVGTLYICFRVVRCQFDGLFKQ
jgi:hypothetical protein